MATIQTLPGERVFLDRHGFTKGIPDRLILRDGSNTVRMAVDLADTQILISQPTPEHTPVGNYSVELSSVNGSELIPTTVEVGQDLNILNVLSSSEDQPYTVLILRNRYISVDSGIVDDDLFFDEPKYQDLLLGCLRSLLFSNETILRELADDGLLGIKMATSAIEPTTAFVRGRAPNIAAPLRNEMVAHASDVGVSKADVIFSLHGSLDYTRASARYSVDDFSQSSTGFEFDGRKFHIGAETKKPGVATLAYYAFDQSQTPLHEFGHAASEERNGRLTDLYHDGKGSALDINKKKGLPRPHRYCDFDGSVFLSDQSRNGIGYESGWKTYHPELNEPSYPNLMDNYWLANGDPLSCKLDKLSIAWLRKRLYFKATRGGRIA